MGSIPDLFVRCCRLAKCFCSSGLCKFNLGSGCRLNRASANSGDDVAVADRAVDIPTITDVKEPPCLVPSAIFVNDDDVINLVAPELSPEVSSTGEVGNRKGGDHLLWLSSGAPRPR